jgi:5-methylcytosine-specific restriction endonuclease McrA
VEKNRNRPVYKEHLEASRLTGGRDMNVWRDGCISLWICDEPIKCSMCRKKTSFAVEIMPEGEDSIFACLDGKEKCTSLAFDQCFNMTPTLESVWVRGLRYQSPRGHKKREPVGLSKRFDVIKRDGYKCVICGKDGRQSRLEVDHIRPVSLGGNSDMSNLQTLCFDCNRGKRDKSL